MNMYQWMRPSPAGLESQFRKETCGGEPLDPLGKENRWWRVVLPLAVGITLAAIALGEYRPHTFLKGDCPYYAAAALSILQDGDFNLKNQIRGGLEVHSTQVALGTRGEWFPKHPVLMPLVSLPFFALFGLDGALVFNLVVVLGLFFLLVRIADRFTTPPAASLAALLVLFATFLPSYVYNYSPDLFGSLLVVAGLALLFGGRPALAGMVLAGAVWAKLPNGIFFAGAGVYLLSGRGWRQGRDFLLGGLPIFLLVAGLQQYMFGAPWLTGYDRTLVLADGVSSLATHRQFFDYPFWKGFREQLFLPGRGILTTSPLLWLALPGSILFWRQRPREATLILSTCTALFLLFCKYRYWSLSHFGNRFLFPLICLSVIPLSYLVEVLRRGPSGKKFSAVAGWGKVP